MGAIVFFEDNGCRGDVVGVWFEGASPTTIHFKTLPGFHNDEARSLRIVNLPKNSSITLWDNPGGSKIDDWAEIILRAHASEYDVNSFERSYEDATVKVTYHRKNGLDGKVSRADVEVIGVITIP